MSVMYIHLTYENYKGLEEQMRRFKETAHRSEGGFYHKSIRLALDDNLIIEFHGPLVGGYGHLSTISHTYIPMVSDGASNGPPTDAVATQTVPRDLDKT